MDVSSLCTRPKRLRRECSPTKIPQKIANLEKSPLPESSNASEDKSTGATNSPGSSNARRNLAAKKWTFDEMIVFFEGLRKHGRNFERIAKLFEQRSKNRSDINNRDVNQCRYFFSRSLRLISSFPQINLNCGIRKRYIDILALINYGEILRKTGRDLHKRTAENLNEMIHKGFTIMKVPGRRICVKTPMCAVVKRFARNRDLCSFVELPSNVTFEFTPRSVSDLNVLRDARISNPFIRLTVPISKSVKTVLRFVEERTNQRAFINFKQFSEHCRPFLEQPKLVCCLHPQLHPMVCSVEATFKPFTPASFNGAQQMLAQGVGLAARPNVATETLTTKVASEKLDQDLDSSPEKESSAQPICSTVSATPVDIHDKPPTFLRSPESNPPLQSSTQSSDPVPNIPKGSTDTSSETSMGRVSSQHSTNSRSGQMFRPQLVYCVPSKNSSTKQFIRVSNRDDEVADMLKTGFIPDSLPDDFNVARLLVMVNVCPVIQIEYFLEPVDVDCVNGEVEEVGRELEAVVSLGSQMSKMKRSQTPVMAQSLNCNSPQNPQSNVQFDSACDFRMSSNAASQDTKTNGMCPMPGSVAEKQLKDHIMMLQSSGKVRLRNRLRHDNESLNSLNENSFRPVVVNPHSVVRKQLPVIAPKLFNQITGSISVSGNGALNGISLGNHSTGNMVSLGPNRNCGVLGSGFNAISTQGQPCLQPISLPHAMSESTRIASMAHASVEGSTIQAQQMYLPPNNLQNDDSFSDIIGVALKSADVDVNLTEQPPGSLNVSDMEPLLCSTQLCSQREMTMGPPPEVHMRSEDVLPSVHEILSDQASKAQQTPHASSSSSGGNRDRNQMSSGLNAPRNISGFSHHVTMSNFEASNDSFMSKRLDGEIEEMLNDNSIDVANKFDDLLNSSSETVIY